MYNVYINWLPTGGADCKSMSFWQQVALSGRVERLFQQSFPGNPVTEVEEKVPPLKCLLEPTEEPGGAPQGPGKGPRTTPPNGSVTSPPVS